MWRAAVFGGMLNHLSPFKCFKYPRARCCFDILFVKVRKWSSQFRAFGVKNLVVMDIVSSLIGYGKITARHHFAFVIRSTDMLTYLLHDTS